ncbi:MAG TPA: sigma-70 family RNA polymerase sigma factor [Acidobacteriaceae bacterium]
MLRSVDSAASNPEENVLPAVMTEAVALPVSAVMAPGLLEELWRVAEAAAYGLTREEFGVVLGTVGVKYNFGVPMAVEASAGQQAAFFRGLHLSELALAYGCARSKEAAWERFVREYRTLLTRAATAITGSASLGEELADSLYAELYGLKEAEGERRSPLASYSGRGSLAGWLRTTLVQRFRDHHRRTHRESPLEDVDCAATEVETASASSGLAQAVVETLKAQTSEDRFLLAAYFLDRRTLLEIGRMLGVHEATISRRLKRLVEDVRRELLKNLQRSGLSKRAAAEALGADPRDLEINLRAVLQGAQISAFQEKTGVREAATDTA